MTAVWQYCHGNRTPEVLHIRYRRRRDESHTTWKRADEPEKDAARSADRPRGQNEKTKEARNKKKKDQHQQSKKERIEPPPLRKNRDKDIARPQTEDEQPQAMEPSPARDEPKTFG